MQISAIYVYPIKSCRGIAVSSATVTARGLSGDRRYMLVDANARFLTQREHPKMALIDVASTADGYRIAAPGQGPLDVPRALAGGTECEVKVWRDATQALLAAEDVNIWFSEYLGFACGLVYMGDHQHRPVSHESALFDDEVSFADGAPLLLTATASLADLNRRLAAPVTMQRFRPNVVVATETPFVEDGWASIATGSVEFAVAWPCARCVLTTIDPDSGTKHENGEPLTTLKSFRRVGARVLFGQNLIPRRHGTIRVGDAVRVVREATT